MCLSSLWDLLHSSLQHIQQSFYVLTYHHYLRYWALAIRQSTYCIIALRVFHQIKTRKQQETELGNLLLHTTLNYSHVFGHCSRRSQSDLNQTTPIVKKIPQNIQNTLMQIQMEALIWECAGIPLSTHQQKTAGSHILIDYPEIEHFLYTKT